MKKLFICILVICIMGCKNQEKKDPPASNKEDQSAISFYIGTYTSESDSKGIYKYGLSSTGKIIKGSLAATTENPSFLSFAHNNTTLLAVNENDPGTLTSFKIKDDSLIQQENIPTEGAHPCFVTTNNDGLTLVANYTGGNIALLSTTTQAKLSKLDVKKHEGSGSHKRQEAPHAHAAYFVPGNNDKIITTDLGTNELWIYTLDARNQKLALDSTLTLPEGAGPRHLDFHPNLKWMYVLNELTSSVSQIEIQKDGYKLIDTFESLPDNFDEENTSADIHISQDGKFLYASNRGHNSITIFKINTADGSLTRIDNQSVRGKTPRNFSLSPDDNFLVVANQDSNNIVSFKRDQNTGLLSYINEVEAPKPVCILFDKK